MPGAVEPPRPRRMLGDDERNVVPPGEPRGDDALRIDEVRMHEVEREARVDPLDRPLDACGRTRALRARRATCPARRRTADGAMSTPWRSSCGGHAAEARVLLETAELRAEAGTRERATRRACRSAARGARSAARSRARGWGRRRSGMSARARARADERVAHTVHARVFGDDLPEDLGERLLRERAEPLRAGSTRGLPRGTRRSRRARGRAGTPAAPRSPRTGACR